MKKGYGLYFLVVGICGILMAFARAKSEREIFLILATIPTAFVLVRLLGSRNKKDEQ